MKEYNLLTQKLLREGYTADHHPEYVRVDTSRLPGNDPLYNLSGGFEYKRSYARELVYKTGCGRFIKGDHVIGQMNYKGISWMPENDNPVFRCPFDKPDCDKNDPLLHGVHGGGLCIQCFCVCHPTDEGYDYEYSIEKADDERCEEMEKRFLAFVDSRHGRVCRQHCGYDERTRTWHQHYEPEICARNCYSLKGKFCPILNKELTKKRGNVFYDLKTSYTESGNILFPEERISVTKGIRHFDGPCSLDICEAFIKFRGSKVIYDRYRWNHSTEFLFLKDYKAEVLNVRAEYRATRDLEQDLRDLEAGIRITFDPDDRKQMALEKKERRQRNKEKREKRLAKKIIENGLEEGSIDEIRANKWFSADQMEDLQEKRQKWLSEEVPVKESLFDLIADERSVYETI